MKRQAILISGLLLVAIYAMLPALHTASETPLTLSAKPNIASGLQQACASNPTGGPITLLAVTEKESGVGLQARPVDPVTLAEIPGFALIDFGHHYTYAVSPGGRTLALITWPSGSSNAGSALHLIDLDTWTDTPTGLRFDDHVSDLSIVTDGRTLYWTMATARDPAHWMPRDYQLFAFDLERHQLSAITQFPSSFMPWSSRPYSGKVAVFGVPTDPNNLAEGVPHVLVVDPTRNRIAADVPLDGVKAGQFYEEAANGTPTAQAGAGQYVMYSPGLAWDLERHLLYIVHAHDDKVTVVDLIEGAARQTRIRPQESAWARISEALTPTAEAKGGPGRGVRAELSPDGKRLYVFSQQTDLGLLSTSSLRVIATDSMREVGRLDELLTDFALAPDGETVLVVKGETTNSYGFDMMVSRDVYVLDGETLRERAHLRADQVDQLWFDGFSPDGRHAFMNGSSARWVEGSGWRNWRTTRQVLDLDSICLVSTAESEGSYSTLLHIAP